MRYLLDTGILVRLPHRDDPAHETIRAALRRLTAQGHTYVAARQNIVEFWGLCTRPGYARGGFNLSINETRYRLRLLERLVEILNEPDSTYRRWKSLVTHYNVAGKQVHDARLVAVMMAYRIKRILTLNAVDFSRFEQIEAITPQNIALAGGQ